MSVAKSYEKYTIVGEPYEHDKRLYVLIDYPCCRKASCSKCGGAGHYNKEVRWYGEVPTPSFNGRQGFGFYEEGYIYLLKGNSEVLEDYFSHEGRGKGWYNTLFFWYIPSSLPIPEDLPENIEPIKLKWEEIANLMDDYNKIRKLVGEKLDKNLCSEFVGCVGDKIELELVVIEARKQTGYYGDSILHIFEDENSNRYIWNTSARKLMVGEIYCLKGTIKEHNNFEGTKHTVLTRCREA